MNDLFSDLNLSEEARALGINQAIVVKVDNVHQYLVRRAQGFVSVMAESPILVPAHQVMWFEFSLEGGSAAGCLVRLQRNSGQLILVVSEFVRNQVGSVSLAQEYHLRLTDRGHIARENLRFCIQSRFKSGLDQQPMDHLAIVLTSLSLLNCDNVDLLEIGRLRTGKRVFGLHVQGIDREKKDELIRKDTNLTIRNGHQKDYRQGDGLFGRWHGIYWWSS
jgi:hypothetical protein